MTKRLKILFLTNRIPFPIKDGQSRRTYNILKGLATTHDVYLLSYYDPVDGLDEKSILHLKTFCKNVEMHPGPSKKLGLSMILRLMGSLISLDPYTFWRHYSLSYLKRIDELTKTGEFDLIHCDILPLAFTIRNNKHLPCIVTDHDVSYLKALRMGRQARNPFLKLLLYLEAFKLKRLESKVFKQADMGIAVSEVDKKVLKELCPEGNLEVIENGVDTDEFKPTYEEIDKDSLVWVGGFENYPNREGVYYFLDKIYPLIKKQARHVKIMLVGGGATQRLKQFSNSDPSINIIGYVNDPLPYIQNAAVFIVPILSGSGTRLKLLEAMAVGKAIVTTSIGCEGIEGTDKEHYLVADQPVQFAEKVATILNNRALGEYLGRNARKLAEEKYDWKCIFEKMDVIYRGLVS